MKYKKYSSISRDTKIHSKNYSKTVQKFFENDFADVKCIYQQKVHGTNFAVYYNGKEFRVGKRSSFLSEDDNFMGGRWKKHVENVKPKLENLYKELVENYPHIEYAAFHCELAGGHYDGEGEGQIQGNTHYCKKQFLYFFDVRIFWEEEGIVKQKVINPLESVKLFEKHDVFHAKIRGFGTLKELMDNTSDFKNYVSLELEGGQIVESEGMVIKSVENNRLYWNQTRILVKKINPKFEESTKKKNNKKPISENIPKEAIDYLLEAKCHVTSMRLDKVCGNLGISVDNFEGKMFGQVMKAMQDDVFKEMETEETPMPKKEQKYIEKKIASYIAPLIREKLL